MYAAELMFPIKRPEQWRTEQKCRSGRWSEMPPPVIYNCITVWYI